MANMLVYVGYNKQTRIVVSINLRKQTTNGCQPLKFNKRIRFIASHKTITPESIFVRFIRPWYIVFQPFF